MKILAIETSCDETALALVETEGGLKDLRFSLLVEELYSQAEKHAEYGGVYPSLAKREHAKNLVPLLIKLSEKSGKIFGRSNVPPSARLAKGGKAQVSKVLEEKLQEIFSHEKELYEQFRETIPTLPVPDIDAIAVTHGPGLEPALWVGINFAQALSLVWNIPVIPVNHLEGHLASVLIKDQSPLELPALGLIVSGGHTDIIHIKEWGDYKHIGGTRDDAAGEAFDKTARLLGLPYPGGPHISKQAEHARENNLKLTDPLPRPMLNTDTPDMSFSGLKTAVMYRITNNCSKDAELTNDEKAAFAREIEDAITDVLEKKVAQALDMHPDITTLIAAGGVMANKTLRNSLQNMTRPRSITLRTPPLSYATDNAVMIALAGYLSKKPPRAVRDGSKLSARGTLPLS